MTRLVVLVEELFAAMMLFAWAGLLLAACWCVFDVIRRVP